MPSQSASIPEPVSLADQAADTASQVAKSGSASVVRRKLRLLRRSPLRDTIFLTLVLTAINQFVLPGDRFWLASNPTPFLLLPLLIGGRYGSASGLLVGLLSAGYIVAMMNRLGTTPDQLFAAHSFTLAAFPVVGLLCGEIHSFFKAKTLALSERCAELEGEHARASANLELYADSNFALQKRLAVHGVRLTSLDSELRRLLGPATTDLYAASLALLNRVTDVSEAAIYAVDGSRLTRRALLGNGDELPENLRADQVEILDQAMVEKKMVTCRELWGDSPQVFSRHLAAVPWIDADGDISAVLVVRRLPFHCATWQHFAQIETICAWISQYAHLKAESQPPSGIDAFQQAVTLCVDTHRKHALPSAAAYFIASGKNGINQHQLEQTVAPLIRETDFATRLDAEIPNLAVLLPMDGRREVEIFVAQVSAQLPATVQSHSTETKAFDSTERLLRRLTEGDSLRFQG